MNASNQRRLTASELTEYQAATDALADALKAMIQKDPNCRFAIAARLLGAAVALCDTFGVDDTVVIANIRKCHGKAPVLYPPEKPESVEEEVERRR